LNDPVRVELLRCLYGQGPGRKMCVREWSEDLGRPRKLVSYHVLVLEKAGAIRPADDSEPDERSIERFYVFHITEPSMLERLRKGTDAAYGGSHEENEAT
jgi:predicted transcriptional regulator